MENPAHHEQEFSSTASTSSPDANHPPNSSYNGNNRDGRLTLARLKDLAMQKVHDVKDRRRVLKPRGPKPEVQVQPTRRQERNRLAQQALRDRRSQYLLFLEQSFTGLQENAKLTAQNEELQRSITRQNIAPPFNPSENPDMTLTAGDAGFVDLLNTPQLSTQSFQAQPQSFLHTTMGELELDPVPAAVPAYGSVAAVNPRNLTREVDLLMVDPDLDYTSIGATLILGLEHLCIDHVQPHALRQFHETGSAHGHALLLSAPSASQIRDFPSTEYYQPDVTQMKSTLRRLLHLSTLLDLEREKITPVMAWTKLERHARFAELRENDFAALKELLERDVRCHGFGAVIDAHAFYSSIDLVLAKRLQ